MAIIYILLFYAGSFFVLIAVHELGHYLAGLLGGIPARDMRIRLLAFPQHVALRDGEQWVNTGTIGRYVELVWQYLRTTPRVCLYIAGGILVETAFTVAAGAALVLAGLPKVATAFVSLSLLLTLPWLIIDTIAVARGRIVGDLSGL